MNAPEQYLNVHSSRSHAALNLFNVIAQSNPSSRVDHELMQRTIVRNRTVLESWMHQTNFKRSGSLDFAARLMSCLAVLRFRGDGLTPGRPYLVEAVEALEASVRAWKCLTHQQHVMPEWMGTDFRMASPTCEGLKDHVRGEAHVGSQGYFSSVQPTLDQ